MPTVIVGCIAARISWQQSRTAEEQRKIASAKLNLDLFTRRLEIFKETWGAASSVRRSSDPVPAPASMTNLYPEASFLFGSEVEEYMNELGHKMNDLSVIRQLTQRNNCVLSPDEINKMKELDEWIYNAAMDGIRNKFSPYLNLGQWR
jgi:hypothetical protein